MTRKNEFEKLIFIRYFIVTLILVLLLIFLEWQLARYSLIQHERVNISNEFIKFEHKQNKIISDIVSIMIDASLDEGLIASINSKNISKIQKRIYNVIPESNLNSLTLLGKNKEYLYGFQWELLDKYISSIFDYLETSSTTSFVTSFGSQLFQFVIYPIYQQDSKDELLGVFIYSNPIFNEIETNFEKHTHIFSYNQQLEDSFLPERLAEYSEKIETIIGNMVKEEPNKIINLNRELALGIKLIYDIDDNISAVLLVSYTRFVNKFIQQSILLFILILLSFTLIMIILMGNSFGKMILLPIKNIVDKMKSIAANPEILEPIEKTHLGVLGDMVDSFNTMNESLVEHSKRLQEYKVITDNIETGIFWLDNNYDVVLCNPSFLKIINRNNIQEIFGKNIVEIFGIKRKLNVIDTITIPNLKIKLDTEIKFIILNIKAVKQKDDYLYYGSILDITKEIKERKAREALEIELIKSNKLAEIGKKVEGIVHNINSPLNSILGFAQLMNREDPDNEDTKKIMLAAKNVTRMIRGLLNKIQKSNISMPAPINIKELILQELELCEHNLFFKHYVILETEFQENLPQLLAVWSEISLCVANILNNAIDAMQESLNRNMVIKTFTQNNSIIISIQDSGCGIKKENMKKIFLTSFTTKQQNKDSGYGLGLAITKNIIEKNRGKVSVISVWEKGSTFTIQLPIK